MNERDQLDAIILANRQKLERDRQQRRQTAISQTIEAKVAPWLLLALLVLIARAMLVV